MKLALQYALEREQWSSDLQKKDEELNRVELERLKLQLAETKAERDTARQTVSATAMQRDSVQKEVENLKSSLAKIASDEVVVAIKHAAVGGVNESDVSLAEASGAIILAFNVTAAPAESSTADSVTDGATDRLVEPRCRPGEPARCGGEWYHDDFFRTPDRVRSDADAFEHAASIGNGRTTPCDASRAPSS